MKYFEMVENFLTANIYTKYKSWEVIKQIDFTKFKDVKLTFFRCYDFDDNKRFILVITTGKSLTCFEETAKTVFEQINNFPDTEK